MELWGFEGQGEGILRVGFSQQVRPPSTATPTGDVTITSAEEVSQPSFDYEPARIQVEGSDHIFDAFRVLGTRARSLSGGYEYRPVDFNGPVVIHGHFYEPVEMSEGTYLVRSEDIGLIRQAPISNNATSRFEPPSNSLSLVTRGQSGRIAAGASRPAPQARPSVSMGIPTSYGRGSLDYERGRFQIEGLQVEGMRVLSANPPTEGPVGIRGMNYYPVQENGTTYLVTQSSLNRILDRRAIRESF